MQSKVLNDRDFPPQASHSARALALGPDGMLYVSVGPAALRCSSLGLRLVLA